jgi:oxygen-dependent protoporphyrinogen oxidase
MLRALGTRMANRAGDAPRVVVIGGGITGLATAHFVHRERPGWDVLLLEKSDRVGGNIRTDRHEGFLLDAGPDSFIRTKPEALDLCRELGIDNELIGTEEAARHVCIAKDGRLELLPGGMALAVPTRIEPLLRTPLLSRAGKMRALAEPLAPASKTSDDESILEFFTRRIGAEAAERLAGPLLSGIYAGDAAELSIRATFPQLVELEERHGSLLRGLLAAEWARRSQGQKQVRLVDVYKWLRRAGEAQAPSPFLSFENGMQTLVDALRRSLPQDGIRVRANVAAVRAVSTGGFVVEVERESIAADAVVIAAPAHAASALLGSSAAASDLGAIRYESTATIFFALDRSRVAHSLEGFGFIVPPGEGGLLAGTWVSSKWRHRAPEGGVLVRAFVGGARDPRRALDATDGELVTFARTELERLMGPLGKMRFARVYRYRQASPQPVLGHLGRVARIRACASETPGLYVAGAAYDGVGIPDCVRQAKAAADTVVRELSRSTELRAATN